MTLAPYAVAAITVAIAFLFLRQAVRRREETIRRRQEAMRHGPRMDDASYLRLLRHSVPMNDSGAAIALHCRTAFAASAAIPRECVAPEMACVELLRMNDSWLSDGLDVAELCMELEDLLDWEIPETVLALLIADTETVASFTGKFLEYATSTWKTPPR